MAEEQEEEEEEEEDLVLKPHVHSGMLGAVAVKALTLFLSNTQGAEDARKTRGPSPAAALVHTGWPPLAGRLWPSAPHAGLGTRAQHS